MTLPTGEFLKKSIGRNEDQPIIVAKMRCEILTKRRTRSETTVNYRFITLPPVPLSESQAIGINIAGLSDSSFTNKPAPDESRFAVD